MKICAIICEYNPFHRGHSYLIEKIKENGATHVVCIMSGNFVQRGEPALFPKEYRVKAALKGGADLVIELPLPYAVDTAERFAFGATQIIKALGCVDNIGFGAEENNSKMLIDVVDILESDIFKSTIKKYLSQGMTFALAREKAVSEISKGYGEILQSPNNILAIEYLKHLRGSGITPIIISRKGANHNDNGINDNFASASYIRNNWGKDEIKNTLLPSVLEIFENCEKDGHIYINHDKFELMMLSNLRKLTISEISKLPSISEGLEYRFLNAIQNSITLDELYMSAKSKRYTHARIRRLALAGFLGIDGNLSKMKPTYIRILGFNKNGEEILSKAKKVATIPISHSFAKIEKIGEQARAFVNLESEATDEYSLLLEKPCKCKGDYKFSPIKE